MDFEKQPSDETATLPPERRVLGRYEIELQLGAGGMGKVFRARDTRLGRSVAIKTSDERFSSRFEIEARAISALNHPNICTLYDVGPDFLVMELVEGETLASRLKRGKIPVDEALRYAMEIAGALTEAHAHGIVHRDLKPSNIMLTRHGVKVLDFGLARIVTETAITAANVVMGTPGYMAPEQVQGREPSAATDLFALGLVIYEMLIGKLPFPGASFSQMLVAGSATSAPIELEDERLAEFIGGLLEKDPAQRPQSASEVARELSTFAERKVESSPARWQPSAIAAALALLVMVGGAALWFYRGMGERRWASDSAVPEINKLAVEQPLAAFLLLQKAQAILPGDPQLAGLAKSLTRAVSVESTPTGATVQLQDYLKAEDWVTIGVTPLKNVRVPNGYFRWKVSKAGEGEFISAPPIADSMKFTLAAGQSGMVSLPEGRAVQFIDFTGWLIHDLPAFDIDKFEVTNAQYQQFVDQGGYRKQEYWKEKFVKDGKELSWEQAMDLFRDPTGRPGPSTWDAGHFPQGHGDYPVSGVSWYEAAAYAAFAGNSLPVISQWYKAAPPEIARNTIGASNFNGTGPAAVGTFAGVGPFGTYDMAGNVREWSVSSMDDARFILGGAWGTQTYQAFEPETLPPLDRSPMNGFRTVRNRAALSEATTAPIKRLQRDFSKEKPASDEVFEAYKAMYAYDRNPLNAASDGVVEETADWTKEKITIDAGYGGQRLPIFLFLPRNVRPPFQTVVFFPSARVELLRDSNALGDMQFVDYTIKSGRALLYPVYNGTYERVRRAMLAGTVEDLQLTIQRSKEVRRALDYLVTRKDVDASKLAYLGVSMGTAYGAIFTTLEDRFQAVVFLDGGFFLMPAARGRDQLDFVPRLKKPVLMVNGKYDFSFSPDRSQEPFFRLLGTAPADKKRVLLDTPHDISQQRATLSQEVLAWLDKYLGRVQ